MLSHFYLRSRPLGPQPAIGRRKFKNNKKKVFAVNKKHFQRRDERTSARQKLKAIQAAKRDLGVKGLRNQFMDLRCGPRWLARLTLRTKKGPFHKANSMKFEWSCVVIIVILIFLAGLNDLHSPANSKV